MRTSAESATEALDRLASDLKIVLSSEMTIEGKLSFIQSTLWRCSERHGKYTTPFRSAEVERATREGREVELRHDHAVPRKILTPRLMEMSQCSVSELCDCLREFCVGVTITRDEDRKLTRAGLRAKMPAGWEWGNWRARYDAAGIEIVGSGSGR